MTKRYNLSALHNAAIEITKITTGAMPYSRTEDLEKISFHFQWALDHDYSGLWRRGGAAVTATQLRFVLAEILGQRGPGSLFRLLQRRRWLPEGSRDQPWVSFLVDVSGFQVLAGARGDAGGVRPAGARVNCLPLKSSV